MKMTGGPRLVGPTSAPRAGVHLASAILHGTPPLHPILCTVFARRDTQKPFPEGSDLLMLSVPWGRNCQGEKVVLGIPPTECPAPQMLRPDALCDPSA